MVILWRRHWLAQGEGQFCCARYVVFCVTPTATTAIVPSLQCILPQFSQSRLHYIVFFFPLVSCDATINEGRRYQDNSKDKKSVLFSVSVVNMGTN